MDEDNTPLTPPPLTPPATTTTNATPSKTAGTSAHSEFREGPGRAHLAPSLLADLKRKQDVSVDDFLTGLLGFVRDKRALPEPQQSTASGSNSPEMSLSDLILQVGVNVANLFCNMNGTTPSGAAASTTSATNGKGYGHKLLQKFCMADNETKRYPIFCDIVNSILARTKSENRAGFLDNNDLDILLQNTSLFEVKIYHQGEESTRKPDCTFLPSAIARMYHDPTVLAGRATRGNDPADLDDKHQLWNAIVDNVAGQSLSTKVMHMHMGWDIHHGVVEKKTGASIRHHKVPSSYAGNQLIDNKPHSPLLDTTSEKYDPANPRHPSRNESLHRTAVESGSKRKADSLEEAGDETNGTDAHNGKRLKTVSNRAVTRPQGTVEDASKVHTEPPQDIPEVQFAGYNAEMLCAPTVIRQHTIGMLNEDKYVHLWWFDHQSPVRSAPLNFIDDLPRFVVFLWILQRLTRDGWGYVPIMRPRPEASAEERLINAEAQGKAKEKPKTKLPLTTPAEIMCKGETYFTDDAYARKHHIWGLNGRKTCVREMRACGNPEVPVAVKVAWQEESRVSEQEIFDQINRVAKGDPKIKDHVPDLLQEDTFAEYSTGTFRTYAGIPHEARGTGYRVLRITVYSMLDGCITDLDGDDFWMALLQCFDCHYKLWLSGIHHRDISAFNLMYKRRGDTVVGVLIDFDLAILGGSQSTNTERTGTMPFMALDILSHIAHDAHRIHLYRYDVESFLWVAIWVCGTYEGGEERQDAPFEAWTQGGASLCQALKLYFLVGRENLWSKSHQARVDVLRKIRRLLRVDVFNRIEQREAIEEDGGEAQPEEPEGPDTEYNRIDGELFSTLRTKLGFGTFPARLSAVAVHTPPLGPHTQRASRQLTS